MSERWLPIPGYENAYEVSDHGRVRSLSRITAGAKPRRVRGTNLVPRPTPTGYLRVAIGQKDRYIHRLVLEAFVGSCPEGMESCHNDGDRSNNKLSNLRWDTRLGNCQDIIAHGTHANLQKEKCPKGHEYDGLWNGWKSEATGQRKKRVCRTCHNERSREAYRRRRCAA